MNAYLQFTKQTTTVLTNHCTNYDELIKKDIISNQTLTKWRITTAPKHQLIEKHYIVTVDNQMKSSTELSQTGIINISNKAFNSTNIHNSSSKNHQKVHLLQLTFMPVPHHFLLHQAKNDINLHREFKPHSRRGVLDTTLCEKACQLLTTGLWLSCLYVLCFPPPIILTVTI